MTAAIVALTLLAVLLFGPLGWLAWRDRRQARALAVRAEILWALRRAFRGESLLSVQVLPATLWHPGGVLLSVPVRPAYGRLPEPVLPVPPVRHAA